MILGVDLDEVLADQLVELVKFYRVKTGLDIPRERFHTYQWANVWNIPVQQAIAIDQEFKASRYFDAILPIPDAGEALGTLARRHKIVIITSRPMSCKAKTDAWVAKNFAGIPLQICYSTGFYNQASGCKSAICKELGVQLMLEDDSGYALDCAAAGIKTLLFDKPWNKQVHHPLITRVYSWRQAQREIELYSATSS